MRTFGDLLFLFLPIALAVFLGFYFTAKTGLLCYGIYSVMMFYQITFAALVRAVLGTKMNTQGDLFWKTFFMLSASTCLSIVLLT